MPCVYLLGRPQLLFQYVCMYVCMYPKLSTRMLELEQATPISGSFANLESVEHAAAAALHQA